MLNFGGVTHDSQFAESLFSPSASEVMVEHSGGCNMVGLGLEFPTSGRFKDFSVGNAKLLKIYLDGSIIRTPGILWKKYWQY